MDEKTNEQPPFVSTMSHADGDSFRLLVEAVKDYGIFMLDPAGNVSSWNPGAEKIKGYKAEDIIGQHVSCFYTAEDVAAGKPQRGLQIALAEGRFEEEGLRLRKGGAPFWAIVTITNIHDALGRHIGFANVTRDITERKQAEIAASNLSAIVESSEDAIIGRTLDGTITSWNSGAERLFGYTFHEIVGQHYSVLVPPEGIGDAQSIMERVSKGERVPGFEKLRRRKDGKDVNVLVSISPVKDA